MMLCTTRTGHHSPCQSISCAVLLANHLILIQEFQKLFNAKVVFQCVRPIYMFSIHNPALAITHFCSFYELALFLSIGCKYAWDLISSTSLTYCSQLNLSKKKYFTSYIYLFVSSRCLKRTFVTGHTGDFPVRVHFWNFFSLPSNYLNLHWDGIWWTSISYLSPKYK